MFTVVSYLNHENLVISRPCGDNNDLVLIVSSVVLGYPEIGTELDEDLLRKYGILE